MPASISNKSTLGHAPGGVVIDRRGGRAYVGKGAHDLASASAFEANVILRGKDAGSFRCGSRQGAATTAKENLAGA
jgi:hypothetical protein